MGGPLSVLIAGGGCTGVAFVGFSGIRLCHKNGTKSSSTSSTGFFLNQVYRSWGHTAHRGWARLLLDRRSLVQVPNAPRRRARADDRYYEENIMESYFHPESDHHIGSGP